MAGLSLRDGHPTFGGVSTPQQSTDGHAGRRAAVHRLATRVEGGIVAGAGHWIADEQPDEQPDELACRLDDFFGRNT